MGNSSISCSECGNPQKARGLCRKHYDQKRRAGELGTVNQTRTDVLLRDRAGNKLCIRCREWLPESTYSSNVTRKDGLSPYCRPCVKDYWVERERDRRYGLPPGTVLKIFQQQEYKCAICSDPIDNSAQVDHDHACCAKGAYACGHCVRGVLCKSCNMLLGSAKDSLDTLRSAVKYLEEWQSR